MSPPKLDVDDWNCPVCMEVLHKPAANVCGHVFCFWCLHHAMSPFTPSKCPLCRSAYANLPSVCLVLHQFLLKAFPTEYKQRLADVAADEEQQEISSPEVRVNEPGGSTSQDGQATFHEEEFLCSRPGCGRLLHNPVVLTCGHTVCGDTCQPQPATDSRGQSTVVCATCGQIVVRQTTVCHQLSHLLQSLFPEAQQHRAQEVASALAAAASAEQQRCTAVADAQHDGQFPQEANAGRLASTAGSAPASDAADTDVAGPSGSGASRSGASMQPAGPGSSQAQQSASSQAEEGSARSRAWPWESARTEHAALAAVAQHAAAIVAPGAGVEGQPVPGLAIIATTDGVGSQFGPVMARSQERAQASAAANPAGGGESSVRFRGLRALAQLTRDANTHFTHHGVGCDSCGVYPIVGRRYRCMDCQEKMGTDLCGPCMDRGLHVTGRFNQQHKPDHQMMLIKPRINELHILQAMNPELSMDSLMYLLEMTVEPEQDAPAEGAASGEDDDYVPGTHWDGTVPGLDGDDQNWAALAAGVRASRDGSGSGQGNGSPSTGTQEGPGATGMAGGGSGSGHGDDNGGRPSDNAEEGGDAGAGGAAIAGWDGSRPGGAAGDGVEQGALLGPAWQTPLALGLRTALQQYQEQGEAARRGMQPGNMHADALLQHGQPGHAAVHQPHAGASGAAQAERRRAAAAASIEDRRARAVAVAEHIAAARAQAEALLGDRRPERPEAADTGAGRGAPARPVDAAAVHAYTAEVVARAEALLREQRPERPSALSGRMHEAAPTQPAEHTAGQPGLDDDQLQAFTMSHRSGPRPGQSG